MTLGSSGRSSRSDYVCELRLLIYVNAVVAYWTFAVP